MPKKIHPGFGTLSFTIDEMLETFGVVGAALLYRRLESLPRLEKPHHPEIGNLYASKTLRAAKKLGNLPLKQHAMIEKFMEICGRATWKNPENPGIVRVMKRFLKSPCYTDFPIKKRLDVLTDCCCADSPSKQSLYQLINAERHMLEANLSLATAA